MVAKVGTKTLEAGKSGVKSSAEWVAPKLVQAKYALEKVALELSSWAAPKLAQARQSALLAIGKIERRQHHSNASSATLQRFFARSGGFEFRLPPTASKVLLDIGVHAAGCASAAADEHVVCVETSSRGAALYRLHDKCTYPRRCTLVQVGVGDGMTKFKASSSAPGQLAQDVVPVVGLRDLIDSIPSPRPISLCKISAQNHTEVLLGMARSALGRCERLHVEISEIAPPEPAAAEPGGGMLAATLRVALAQGLVETNRSLARRPPMPPLLASAGKPPPGFPSYRVSFARRGLDFPERYEL